MAVANITPIAETDGILYANAVPLTSSEADLFGGTGANSPDPVPTVFGAAIIAVVKLSTNGLVTGNSTFVFLQQDLGDGVWVDINWCFFNQVQGSATFVFSNGVAGADTFQQSRNSGSAPSTQANGSNQLALGGRLRFTGFAVMTGGSSSAPGVSTQITTTIRYKLLPLR